MADHATSRTGSADQKSFLHYAKGRLTAQQGRLTWDQFAALLGVEPRALKTYRMPPGSSDYRTMPKLLIEKIDALLDSVTSPEASVEVDSNTDAASWPRGNDVMKLLPASLAALVVRQARQVFMGGGVSMVSGIDRVRTGFSGLEDEDRRAMALVSRARLSAGLSDVGAEIHQLLTCCKQALGEWLPVPCVKDAGLASVRLIDPEDRMPTLEAEELAAGFSGATGLLEEQVFSALQDALAKQPSKDADEYYSQVRAFVVRNPVVQRAKMFRFYASLPTAVWSCIDQQFYEPVPSSLVAGGEVKLCSHCGNVIAMAAGALRCTTAACFAEHGPSPGDKIPATDLYRLNKSLRKYWFEPGIDELRLAEKLEALGHKVRLYPNRDTVDLDLGEGSYVGVDLKAYSSPELLGERLKRRPGGLRAYKKPLLVIPDWLARRVPSYIDRVNACLEGTTIRALTLSDAVEAIGRA